MAENQKIKMDKGGRAQHARSRFFRPVKSFTTVMVVLNLVFGTVMPVLLYPLPLKAVGNPTEALLGRGNAGVPVTDVQNTAQEIVSEAARHADVVAGEAKDDTELTLKSAVFVALKQSLSNFLNTIAYDTATWLASGGEGQQPMFYTEGWGEYLTNLIDGAAGQFVEKIADNFEVIDVCNPSSFNLRMRITLGLLDTQRPEPPNCSLTQIGKNWRDFVTDPNFIDHFAPVFDIEHNDIGISFEILDKFDKEKFGITEESKLTRAGNSLKEKVDEISKKILSPLNLLDEQTRNIIRTGQDAEWVKVQYGDIVLDAIDTFTNTLAGKLFERLLKEGLLSLSGGDEEDGDDNFSNLNLRQLLARLRQPGSDLYQADSSAQGFGGRTAAELRFLALLQTGNKEVEPYDVLTQFASCPDPENPGPEECVIRQSMRAAIEREMTIKEAIARGFINGNAPFAVKDGSINETLPYRSILILRAHRIVPVGWETAANIIHNASQYGIDPDRIYTLNEVISRYEKNENEQPHPFNGLIDENWVLKAPAHVCVARGYGEKLIYDQLSQGSDVNGDGDYDDENDVRPERIIGRAEYCADYQSCLQESDDGTCQYYGHCVEERPIWDLNAVSCEDAKEFNTCRTFQDATNGGIASYLMNTLDYGSCNIDNAGCQWYCQNYNYVSDNWSCTGEGENIARTCAETDGCEMTASCSIPLGGTNCDGSSARLALNTPCSAASPYFDSTTRTCQVSSSCEIPFGGSSCSMNSCRALPSLLSNGSFETPRLPGESNSYLANEWIMAFPDDDGQFWDHVFNEQSYSGPGSLRYRSDGGNNGVTLYGKAKAVPAGSYTFSGYVYNRLNAGTIQVVTTVDGNTYRTYVNPDVRNEWQRLTFDFEKTTGGNVNIVIIVGGSPVSGTAYFDDFRITAPCAISPVKLSFIGDATLNESKITLDRDAQACDAGSDGCSEFIRTKENLGVNIVPNGSIETWSALSEQRGWNATEGGIYQTLDSSVNGSASLTIQPDSNAVIKIPGAESNKNYYLSFWLKTSGENEPQLTAKLRYRGPGGTTVEGEMFAPQSNVNASSEWRRVVLNRQLPQGSDFALVFDNSSSEDYILLDAVKMESYGRGGSATAYTSYGDAGRIHLKKAPDYLNCTGSESDPSECLNYALYCEPEEVGCEAYQPKNGGSTVPGVVGVNDYCPIECVGYDSFSQSATFFEANESMAYFIPETARQCNVESVGCDEFTNLDEVARGGEGREYYKYIRLCEKPEDATAACQSFYTWQGSDETGYQLKVHSLSTQMQGGKSVPRLSLNDPDAWPSAWGEPENCDDASDLASNPFCKEFFSAVDGSVFYAIEQNTVSCSGDCHPYRKTNLGDDTEAECEADGNGEWRDGACVYQAIPGQGLACNAGVAGCREYRGNSAGNVYTAFSATFEPGITRGWSSGDISTEALSIGGHSLQSEVVPGWNQISTMVGEGTGVCSDTLPACDENRTFDCFDQLRNQCVFKSTASGAGSPDTCVAEIGQRYCGPIYQTLSNNKTYIISFWAKTNAVRLDDAHVKIDTAYGGAPDYSFTIKNDWNYYEFGPLKPEAIERNSRLIFRVAGTTGFFVDNIEIKEVTGYVYAIKNSWNTPASCDTNPYVTPAVGADRFMLGCKAYTDRAGTTHNLKSFSKLCREEAVGCEALIDTQNSSSPFQTSYNANNEVGDITIAEDKLVYIVNREEFQCNAEFKGCQQVGVPSLDQNNEVVAYQSTYLINNPDLYDRILCSGDEVGCSEFQSGSSLYYFKNPGQRTCEYRQIPGDLNQKSGWFITGSASTEPDCPLEQPLLGELHPSDNYVGYCPAEFNGCSQFVDPITKSARNEVYNPDFSRDIDANGQPDDWIVEADHMYQELDLVDNTLYTLSVTMNRTEVAGEFLNVIIDNCPEVTSYDSSLLQNGNDAVYLPGSVFNSDNREIQGLGDVRTYTGRFRNENNRSCQIVISSLDPDIPPSAYKDLIDEISVRETNVYYALEGTVDRLSCNGLVSEENGCVLLNDRSKINYRLGEQDTGSLMFDADVSGEEINNSIAVSSCNGACDSNAVIKVRPDRECSQWLSCTSRASVFNEVNGQQVETSYCLDVGLCDRMDKNGQCISYVPERQGTALEQSTLTPEQAKNRSGFSTPRVRVTDTQTVEKVTDGYFDYHEMSQFGSAANVVNGDFETSFGGTTAPVGWSVASSTSIEWQDFMYKQVKDGITGIQGEAYLRLNSYHMAISEEIDVEPNADYILSGWVRTKNLRDTGTQTLPKGQICLRGRNLAGTPVVGGSECPEALRVVAGRDWTYVNQVITAEEIQSANVTKLNVMLKNYSATEAVFGAGEAHQNRKKYLVGYAEFDDIQLKPVLTVNEVQENELNDENFVTRSCRVYPASSSLACKIQEGETVYYGQHGYCLVKDPQNPKQCLQWWPVDQLSGEVTDDAPVYRDRAPLYYCIKKNQTEIKFAESETLTFRAGNIPEKYDFIEDQNGQIVFVPFKVSSEFRPLFRWPYVQKIRYSGLGIGYDSGQWGVLVPFGVTMYKDGFRFRPFDPNGLPGINTADCQGENQPWYCGITRLIGYNSSDLEGGGICHGTVPEGSCHVCINMTNPEERGCEGLRNIQNNLFGRFNNKYDSWGGWGAIPFPFSVESVHVAFAIPFPWGTMRVIDELQNIAGSFIDGYDLGLGVMRETLSGSKFGAKVVTDQDSEFASNFEDPVPDLDGDILGMAVYVDTAVDAGGVRGKVDGKFIVQYCEEIVQVVTSANTHKAWAGRVSEGSGYELNYTSSDDLFDYPLYSNTAVKVDSRSYRYDNPFQYDAFLANPFTYRSSDYRPFGSMVAPEKGQYPDSWDSRTSVAYRQPLYYEPPRTSFNPPYQARMGEVHSVKGLQRLFLQTYGFWKWCERKSGVVGDPCDDIDTVNNELMNDDRYYKINSINDGYRGWDVITEWSTNNGGYCTAGGVGNAMADGSQRVNERNICRVRPKVSNIRVNDLTNVTLNRAGSVKLSFNLQVDPNQIPLKSYVVDWGDGTVTTVTGASLLDRPNPLLPFVLYHSYDYWEMKKVELNEEGDTLGCQDVHESLCCDDTQGFCRAKVKVKVKDNWNAETSCVTSYSTTNEVCNTATNPDPNFVPMTGVIQVQI